MRKIYLSPSDQTYNTYAVGNTNEAVQCRKIALALIPALVRCGFQAKTDTTDEASMYDRVRQSNDWGADLHIAIHTNAHNTKVKGTRLFCYDRTGEGYRACAAIMAALAPITPGESDSITVRHFYEVRDAHAPTVYLEVAFHDNPEEAAWIIDHTEEIAEAVCQGVCAHYGVDYTNPQAQEPEENGKSTYTLELAMLRKGDEGEAVKALQRLLIGSGYTCGTAGADGIFGSYTENALLLYQEDHGLTADGIAGPVTMTSLLGY